MRRIGLLATAAAMALLFTACGGESGDEEPGTTNTTTDSSVTTPAATDPNEPTTTTTEGEDEGGSGDSSGLPEMSGGSATFTIAGETEVFDWFVCFSGDATALLEEDEDLTFLAVGRRGGSFPSMEGIDAQIIVAQGELGLVGTQQDIFYTRIGSDGAETSWVSTVPVDEEGGAEIEGGRVTFEGEMERIVDGQASDETDPGSLEATCSPNSVGS